MITTAQLSAARDTVQSEMAWLAVGNSTAAVTGNETQLVNEIKRVALGSTSEPSAIVLKAIFDLLDTDGALNIREIGIFAGGTIATNSGRLITRILYNRDKTSLESIQFNYTYTVWRA
jgi:hypothetical protein